MKRLLSSVGLWYIVAYIPILLVLWWGWRQQRTVRLATKKECKGEEPIAPTEGAFFIFGVAKDEMLRYCVAEISFEHETRKNHPRIDVVFSGCRDAKRRVFRRAMIVVRGSVDDCVKLKQHVDALETA